MSPGRRKGDPQTMEVLREQTLFFMGLCNINSYIRIYLVMIHDDVPKKSEFEFPEPDGNVPKLKDLLEDFKGPKIPQFPGSFILTFKISD